MIPLIGVPATIAQGMSAYRDVFCRDVGFEHISRYTSGLLLNQNKTLQGIQAQQVYREDKAISQRAMHEARWDSEALMRHHRRQVGLRHQGCGREIISLDWTLSHHEEVDAVATGKSNPFGPLAKPFESSAMGVNALLSCISKAISVMLPAFCSLMRCIGKVLE